MNAICDSEYLWDTKPSILTANTYYWSGFYGNAKARHQKSAEYVEDVGAWFMKIKDCLQREGVKGIKVEENLEEPCVYMYDGDKEIASFCISSSASNVYKHQNIRKLKTLVKKVGKHVKEKKVVGQVPTKKMMKLYYQNYIYIPKSWASEGDIEKIKVDNKSYLLLVHGCGKHDCDADIVKPDGKILKKYGKPVCDKGLLDAFEKAKVKNMDELVRYCTIEKLEEV